MEGLPMEERMRRFEEFQQEMAKLLRGKGADYTAGKKDEDSLYNFRAIAKFLEGAPITPYTVAMIYMLKHTFSLITFAKTGVQESGEGIRGRHIDQANYTFLLNELAKEHAAICQRQLFRARVRACHSALPEKEGDQERQDDRKVSGDMH
jgi:hypothetical protein